MTTEFLAREDDLPQNSNLVFWTSYAPPKPVLILGWQVVPLPNFLPSECILGLVENDYPSGSYTINRACATVGVYAKKAWRSSEHNGILHMKAIVIRQHTYLRHLHSSRGPETDGLCSSCGDSNLQYRRNSKNWAVPDLRSGGSETARRWSVANSDE